MKTWLRKPIALLLTLAMCLSLLPMGALAADGDIIVEWGATLVPSGSSELDNGIDGRGGSNSTGAKLTRGGAGADEKVKATFSNQTVWTPNWTPNDSYWEIKYSTTGITGPMHLKAGQYSTSSGPKEFQLKYSVNGTDFTNLGEPYSVFAGKVSTPAVIVDLPSATQNQEWVYIRFYPTDGTPGGSNNSRIHDISVVQGSAVVPVTKPSANPTGGTQSNPALVKTGAEIEISTVSGATFTRYTWNGENPERDSAAVPVVGTKGTLNISDNTYAEGGVHRLKVRAWEPGKGASEVLEGYYTTKLSVPVASPAAGTAPEGQEVTLTAAKLPVGGKIYYTTDGTAPTAASGEYSAPIALNFGAASSVTVKAIAIAEGYDSSEIVSLTYTKGAPNLGNVDIAEARKEPKDKEVTVKGVITGTSGASVFIQDETGGIVINMYLSGNETSNPVHKANVGDEILVKGKISPYNELVQVRPALYKDDPTAVQVITPNKGVPAPLAVSTEALATGRYEGMYVTIPGVTLTGRLPETTKLANHEISKSGTKLVYRAWLNDTYVKDNVYDVTGCAGRFNADIQLMQVGGANSGIVPGVLDGNTLDDVVEVAGWSYANVDTLPIAANSGVNKAGAQVSLNAGSPATNGKGLSGNGWHDGVGTKYWQATFSTKDVANVTVSSEHASSATGPKNFKLEYSVNGGAFREVIGGRFVVPSAANTADCQLKGIALPMDADNQTLVTVRWTVNSTVSANNGTVGSGGTNQINGISIKGRELYGPDAVAPVKASPAAGNVSLGSEVRLTNATAGTTIYYTLDNTAPTTSSTVYEGPITLATLPVAIQAIAVKNSDPSKMSAVKIFEYSAARVSAVRSNKPDGSKISVDLDRIIFSTVEKDTTIRYVMTAAGVEGAVQVYDPEQPIVLTAEQFPVSFRVWASKAGYADGDPVVFNYILSAGGAPKNYFGQLHAHTAENSDGAGTLDEAFNYAANKSGVDFLAVTDHSNSFDTGNKDDGPETYNLTTYNANNVKWRNGINAAAQYTSDKFVGMYGYEMTWSGGPGHINTFNTTGFVSRNNTILNTKTEDRGMRAYYELLSRPESAHTISQFNHPGETFGNFANFGYWDPIIDTRIALVEVGNGEGAIGSGGYFPSYSQYILALDKGWHVAPTNNQDNHQGKWGDANNARTVIYTNDLTLEGVYQAMRDRRIYATEDKNLDIVYTLNGVPLGTTLASVPASAAFKVAISDPDATDKIAKVEIVSTGGKVVHSVTPNEQNYTLEHTITAPEAGYYFIRIQQADLDIAVTAPVWLGAAKAVGMSEMTTDSYMAVKDEALKLKVGFFNNEDEVATVTKVSYAIKGGAVITALTPNLALDSMSTKDYTYDFTPTATGTQTVVITAEVRIGDWVRELTSEITFNVKDADELVYVGVDASHYNEYVAGNYKDSMGNFAKLAGGHDVRVVVLKTQAELLAALSNPKYKMFVFTAPTRRLSPIPGGTYPNYSTDEIASVKAFAERGGIVVVAGWGDYYESYDYSPKNQADHMAAQQNNLLKAIGSSLRLADDEAKDNDNNPGSNAARLYLTDYNGFKSPLLAGVNPKQVWSQYGGSTVFAVDGAGKPAETLPASVTPVISGYGAINSDGSGKKLNKIDSYDDDKDGYGLEFEAGQKPPKYESDMGKTVLLTATETMESGALIIVTGGAFMSNFEIKAELENSLSLNYSNFNFLENLIERVNPPEVSTIAQAQAGEVGETFIIEGVVTSSVWNGSDENTGFFDCIYVQDETGGINVFPVSSGVEPGQRIRVTGIRSAYEGERQLQNAKVKVLTFAPGPVPTPKEVTTSDVKNLTYLGTLVRVTGEVISVNTSGSVVQSFQIKDSSGEACTVYIDGYITKSKEVSGLKARASFTAIGISSYNENNGQARIRVRDRADVFSAPSGGPITMNPGDVKEGEASVEVKLPPSGGTLSSAANEKIVAANATKPVVISGGSLNVLIPAGILVEGADVNAMLVNSRASGNVIRVTKPDGSTVILPIAIVESGKASYVANIPGTYQVVDNTKAFSDTRSHWAADAIDFAASHELFKGMGDGTFAPEMPMTRGMLVTVLSRIDGGKTSEGAIFADVSPSAWYAKEIAWAAQNKLVEGDGKNFNPDGSLTREQLCVILIRYLEHSGLTLEENNSQMGTYADMASVNPWAKSAMEQAVRAGLISGKSGGILDPQGKATRAEIATILQRFVEGVLK